MAALDQACSINDGAEALSWLSKTLCDKLREDRANDPLVQSADISLEPIKEKPALEFVGDRIDDALRYWEELAKRIPLKREVGRSIGRHPGTDHVFLDFDITELRSPPDPPSGEDPVQMHSYYLKHLMCTVPRVEDLKARNEAPDLRIRGIASYLSDKTKKPLGDTHLMREGNYVGKSNEKRRRRKRPESGNDCSEARADTGESDQCRSSGELDAEETPASSRGRSAATAAVGRILPGFSEPCRTVVTFALCRSGVSRNQPEKRLFEVEALEHNTLQEVMETFPPCLSDRVIDSQRQSLDTGSGVLSAKSRQCLTLDGGFIFARGTFYVTKAAEGEDDSPQPPYPIPAEVVLEARAKAKAKSRGQQQARASAKGSAASRKGKRRKRDFNEQSPAPEASGAGETDGPLRGSGNSVDGVQAPKAIQARSSDSLSRTLPNVPWMRRWLDEGGKSWPTRKLELLKESEEYSKLVAAGEDAEESEARVGQGQGTASERNARREAREDSGVRAVSDPADDIDAVEGSLPGEAQGGHKGDASEREDLNRECEGGKRGNGGKGRGMTAEGAGSGDGVGRSKKQGRVTPSGSGSDELHRERVGEAADSRRSRQGNRRSGSGNSSEASSLGGGVPDGNTADRERTGEDDEGDDLGQEGTNPSDAVERGKGKRAAANATGLKGRRKFAKKGAVIGDGPGEGSGGQESGAAVAGAVKRGRKAKNTKTNADTEAAESLRRNQGNYVRCALGMADGGDVVWASDVTVGDFKPILGERYSFLHHGDCDHSLIISDMRLDPIGSSTSSPAAARTDVMDVRHEGPRTDNQDEDDEARGAGCDRGDDHTGRGESSEEVAGDRTGAGEQRRSTVHATKGRDVEDGEDPDEAKGGTEIGLDVEDFPRLSHRVKTRVKRCGTCMIMMATYVSYGHPLSDQVPVYCCRRCFGMLHYDEQGRRLEGREAGEKPDAGVTLSNWRVFQCFDEL